MLSKVTGCYGVLEVDNCGSFTELDSSTMEEIKRVCVEKKSQKYILNVTGITGTKLQT